MKTKKKFKKVNCGPSTKKKYSCFSDKSLYKLKKFWNIKHPDIPIKTNNTYLIWKFLKKNLNICESEKCWLKQNFIKNNLDTKLLNYTFAPKAPNIWKKNKNTWLSSVDIEKVMKQYEYAYPNFAFIGPSPIDFDTRKLFNSCVWNELCNFNLENYIKNKKTLIGIIFNIDPHYKGGSHWVAMIIDIKKQIIFYFDSTGLKSQKEVKILVDRIKEQGKKLKINFKYMENAPFEHQEGDTECGIYTLYFIIEILKKSKNYKFFKNVKILDSEMEGYRKIYYN